MFKPLATIVAIAALAGGASAQSTASSGGLGGLRGLLGGSLPNVASVGAGNAAGLLGYCLKNNLLGAAGAAGAATGTTTGAAAQPTGAQLILQRLTGRQGVATSPGFAAGQAGQVQTGAGHALSLDSLRGQVKTRVCSAVLSRAKSFL